MSTNEKILKKQVSCKDIDQAWDIFKYARAPPKEREVRKWIKIFGVKDGSKEAEAVVNMVHSRDDTERRELSALARTLLPTDGNSKNGSKSGGSSSGASSKKLCGSKSCRRSSKSSSVKSSGEKEKVKNVSKTPSSNSSFQPDPARDTVCDVKILRDALKNRRDGKLKPNKELVKFVDDFSWRPNSDTHGEWYGVQRGRDHGDEIPLMASETVPEKVKSLSKKQKKKLEDAQLIYKWAKKNGAGLKSDYGENIGNFGTNVQPPAAYSTMPYAQASSVPFLEPFLWGVEPKMAPKKRTWTDADRRDVHHYLKHLPVANTARALLLSAHGELAGRGLRDAASFCTGLVRGLEEPDENISDEITRNSMLSMGHSTLIEKAILSRAKAHFEMNKHHACYTLLENNNKCVANNNIAIFLKHYSLFLIGEKRKDDLLLEIGDAFEKTKLQNSELKKLQRSLSALSIENKLDGCALFLYAKVLFELNLRLEARNVLVSSLRSFPCNISAWELLIQLVSECGNAEDVRQSLTLNDLSNHFMVDIFDACLLLELNQPEAALKKFQHLEAALFPNSSFITSKIALCHYDVPDFESSQIAFERVRKTDAYNLKHLETYSNILYVKELNADICQLAQFVLRVDKFSLESCCILGNYFSLKGDHLKAVAYFKRALVLKRNYVPAMVLIGHEFMELKNTPSAIAAYRSAINTDPRDYRGWYGLAQTYELINLPFYAIFYYKIAMTLRPKDPRVWCAMAGCHEALGQPVEALKCYEKGHGYGDRESLALPRLAKLYSRLPGKENRNCAAKSYQQLMTIEQRPGAAQTPYCVEAMVFLMHFHYKKEDFEASRELALKVLDCGGSEKDNAKAILRNIRNIAISKGVADECNTTVGVGVEDVTNDVDIDQGRVVRAEQRRDSESPLAFGA
eukprot:gene138-456_t